MLKKTIQKTVSIVVMVAMLSSHVPVVQAETDQERKQRIFNEAKSFGVNASQTTSSGITGGFATPDGSTYGANDIPGYNPNAAEQSGLHSTFSSGRDDFTSITNIQSRGIDAQASTCTPVPEGDPGFQEYQYCLARSYLSDRYQTATTNPYKSVAVDMKARAEQTNNPFLNALGLNIPLEEGVCVDSTVTIPGSTVEEACRDAKFTNLVGHTRSKAIEHWDYRAPFCDSQHPSLPLDLSLSGDKSSCQVHHCNDMTYNLNTSTLVCSKQEEVTGRGTHLWNNYQTTGSCSDWSCLVPISTMNSTISAGHKVISTENKGTVFYLDDIKCSGCDNYHHSLKTGTIPEDGYYVLHTRGKRNIGRAAYIGYLHKGEKISFYPGFNYSGSNAHNTYHVQHPYFASYSVNRTLNAYSNRFCWDDCSYNYYHITKEYGRTLGMGYQKTEWRNTRFELIKLNIIKDLPPHNATLYKEPAKCEPGFELADDPANAGKQICRKFSHYACPEGQFLDGDMCQDSTGFLLQEQASCQVVEEKPEEDLRVFFCDAPENSGCSSLSNDCTLKEETCTYYDEVSGSDTYGQCLSWFRKYDCPLPSVTTTVTQCAGSDQVCIDGNCFNDMQKMCGNQELSELEANATTIENKSCQEYMKEEYPTCEVQPVYEMLPSPYNKNQLIKTLVGYEPVDDCPWIDEQVTAETYSNGCRQLPITQDEDGNWPTEARFACWGDRTDFFCKDYINDSECTHEQTFCDRYSQFSSNKCLDLESRYRCERPKYVPTDECTSDFAEVLLGMETARQAGTYMDPDNNRIFSGEYSRCDYRRATTAVGSFGHKDCCKASAPDPKSNAYNMGEDLTGQLIWQGVEYGIQSASNFVYDATMTAGRYFSQGADAWMKTANTAETASTAASGTSLASGLSVSAAGFTATMASTTGMATIGTTTGATTFSTAMTSGAMQTYSVGSIGPVNLTFNPAMFYIAVAIALYSAYQDAIACDNEDYTTATKNKGKLCYAYGSYCASKQCTLWGSCTCTTHRTNHCCFNSKIARIINQQGKPQLGIPLSQCSGFTPEQFVQLDFSQIDLSEFVSDILQEAKKQAVTAADVDMLQNKIKNSISASGADGVQVDKPLTMQ